MMHWPRRICNAVIIAGMALFITLPLVFFSAAPWTDTIENRRSAPAPAWPHGHRAMQRFPAAAEAWFNDHFGFRTFLVALRAQFTFWVFRQSPSSQGAAGPG